MKISFIGAGNVGATAAHILCMKDIADEVVLVDIAPGVPQGKALDIQESMPLVPGRTRVTGTNEYPAIAGSDIIVVTAGVARKPGMSRDDLLGINTKIISGIAEKIADLAPDSVVIVVTNPLDVMSHVMLKGAGLPPSRVIGMAGVLDSARYRTFLALETGAKMEDVKALVLGGHGDSMVPLAEHTTIGGKPVASIIPPARLVEIIERTKNGGAEIVKLLGSGSAYYAPGASVVAMIEAMIADDDQILPCSVQLQGEYGHEGIFLGVPVRLGPRGVKEIVVMKLSQKEKEALDASASEVRKVTVDAGV